MILQKVLRNVLPVPALWLTVALLSLLAQPKNCFASEPQNYLIKNSNSVAEKPRDPWLAVDKYRHLMASALLVGIISDVLRVEGNQPRDRAVGIGVSITLSLGIGKELYDRSHPGHVASWRDLAADLAGIAVGILCFARR